MLLLIFTGLYELVCGENTEVTEYRDGLFSSIGVLTLVAAVIICLVFYVVLGRWRMIWFNNFHWSITLIFCAGVGFLIAFLIAKDKIGGWDGYLIRFAVFNALYLTLYFVAFSFIFKNLSVFSKRTPI